MKISLLLILVLATAGCVSTTYPGDYSGAIEPNFKKEVYNEPEFLDDCYEYMMEECFE